MLFHVRTDKASLSQVRPVYVSLYQVKSGSHRSVQVMSGYVRLGLVNPG
jgi:hypothetical protein